MRSVRLLAAAALTFTALVAAAPALAADTGQLHVTVVDEHGDAMPGAIYLLSTTGLFSSTEQTADWTTPVEAGTYGLMSLSPWGGMLCDGLKTCDYSAMIGGGTNSTDGTLQVVAGETTEVVLRAAKPVRLSGPARVGKELSLTFSPGLQSLIDYFGSVGGTGLAPAATWLRDGMPVSGADGYDYVPTTRDGGHELAVTLAYTGLAEAQFQYVTGVPSAVQHTAPVRVGKVPTKAFVMMSRSTVPAGQHGAVRAEVTAPDTIVTGKAVIAVGGWKVTRPLRNGGVRVRLPQLKAGTYDVTATYLGTSAYAASKAKPKTLRVTR